MDRIKELKEEIRLTERLIELQKQLNELKGKQVEYVPYLVYPYYPPQPFIWGSGGGTTSIGYDTITSSGYMES